MRSVRESCRACGRKISLKDTLTKAVAGDFRIYAACTTGLVNETTIDTIDAHISVLRPDAGASPSWERLGPLDDDSDLIQPLVDRTL